jgi:hypothetical protein
MINAEIIGSSPEGDREATPGPIRAREQVTRRDLPQKLPPFCQTWRWHATSDAQQRFARRRAGRFQAAAKPWALRCKNEHGAEESGRKGGGGDARPAENIEQHS